MYVYIHKYMYVCMNVLLCIMPFVLNATFLYHFTVLSCFQGVEKGCIGNKWVNILLLLLVLICYIKGSGKS